MQPYEARLSEFAKGKQLLRLRRPIRDRADAMCDACGSTQPSMLYALKDLVSERHVFVGATCLTELSKRGAVMRRYGKESGPAAYDQEMVLRSQENVTSAIDVPSNGASSPSEPDPSPGQPMAINAMPVIQGQLPAVLVIQTPQHYQVFVVAGSSGTNGLRWDGGMILDRIRMARPDALEVAIERARESAAAAIVDTEIELAPTGHLDGGSVRFQVLEHLVPLVDAESESASTKGLTAPGSGALGEDGVTPYVARAHTTASDVAKSL